MKGLDLPLNAVFLAHLGYIQYRYMLNLSPYHEICWISCMKSARFHGAVFFIRTNTDI